MARPGPEQLPLEETVVGSGVNGHDRGQTPGIGEGLVGRRPQGHREPDTTEPPSSCQDRRGGSDPSGASSGAQRELCASSGQYKDGHSPDSAGPGGNGFPGEPSSYELSRAQPAPGGSAGKEPACHAGDPGSIPGSGRSPGKGIGYPLHSWASLVAQLVKNPPAMRETWVQSLG